MLLDHVGKSVIRLANSPESHTWIALLFTDKSWLEDTVSAVYNFRMNTQFFFDIGKYELSGPVVNVTMSWIDVCSS